jgi:hypothetical protein
MSFDFFCVFLTPSSFFINLGFFVVFVGTVLQLTQPWDGGRRARRPLAGRARRRAWSRFRPEPSPAA